MNERPVETSPSKYPWAPVQAALDSQSGPYAKFTYQGGFAGGHVSQIIGAHAERVDAGTQSPPRQESSSFVFHVYQGNGYTLVGEGEQQKKLVWTQSDVFAVPHWRKIVHVVGEGETAYLFSFSDTPMLSNLGSWRENKFE